MWVLYIVTTSVWSTTTFILRYWSFISGGLDSEEMFFPKPLRHCHAALLARSGPARAWSNQWRPLFRCAAHWAWTAWRMQHVFQQSCNMHHLLSRWLGSGETVIECCLLSITSLHLDIGAKKIYTKMFIQGRNSGKKGRLINDFARGI